MQQLITHHSSLITTKILSDFRNGLENPDLLKWPKTGNDPCGPLIWPHIGCSNGRVISIQVSGLGLTGPLPPNLNQLSELKNLSLQKNYFNGNLPSFSGLSNLQHAYLNSNEFETIPLDFFHGLSNVMVIALDYNPLNQSSGWALPHDLAECTRLVNFSCSFCNIIGEIPLFFGKLSSLNSLRLSSNRLSGGIPSSFHGSLLQILWLNDQENGGMNGSISVVGSMVLLTQLWLHGNQFTGPIPDTIGYLASLRELNVNGNQLVGLIPPSLTRLTLKVLDLSNNLFMGPMPKLNAASLSYGSNSFCQSGPGLQCDPQVDALLEFLGCVEYPIRLASEWKGNDPCAGPWWGVSCNPRNEVSVVNMKDMRLNGTISPSIAKLSSLVEIHLDGNYLHGRVPRNLTMLRSLRLLDLRGNDFEVPLPKFSSNVNVVFDHVISRTPSSPNANIGATSSNESSDVVVHSPKSRLGIILASAAIAAVSTLVAVFVIIWCLGKRKDGKNGSNGDVKSYGLEGGGGEIKSNLESGTTLSFSVEALREVTDNFAQENVLGRGGFGVVYKGRLEDGTMLAVKRMEFPSGVMGDKGTSEFQTEIAVLSTVRHRHLVSLLGYSGEGNEKLLVYEYMPQGALSRHLFYYEMMNLEPLCWPKRLTIALDVARGVEYLHSMAHHSFIHRDLKSSNILLDHEFRAKVSDFGLVKLALDTGKSFATRLAGTFGYLAPEYAVTGKITTKVDVFSFGVILMELVTGLVAVDERRPEEKQYLVEWFWQIKDDKATMLAAVDPALNVDDETRDSIIAVADLAGHCTVKDPSHRADMGYAVTVLARLVDTWRPHQGTSRCSSNRSDLPLPELVRSWQEEDLACSFRIS
ncbi:LOW QUALITY PROTEIN: receptor-like kinase TMK3 [Salvia miltiorrhiza]|uniref:LOW QUALITY PROTEIN: receptor-like kinase TMK3 n=1 Tax=Salvia miltiorrhiza TaxID=226208 RepID=UPI0025AD209D|nr:LOW QUALITY PROTEIN: receptor-like kinase TMK3 [Salvia miltiorrhiza]